jgi:uncharacterized protein (DUF1800 family)
MVLTRGRLTLVAVSASLLCFSSAIARQKAATSQSNERQRAIQALNRLTFGPRPGDIDRVLSIGVDKWIDLQLHPESIKDDALDARLAPFRTLRMSTRELVENFPPQALIRQIANGREGLPRDPRLRAIYEAQLERYRERQEKKGASADQNDSMMVARPISDADASQLVALPPDQRLKALLKMTPEEQGDVMASLKGGMRQDFLDGMPPQDRETVVALANPQRVVAEELMQAKVLRATYSERQLQEVMTDFWFNHFNVFIGKGADRYDLSSYERDVIRAHALGKFEDLLVATAQSPAMLFYLDNWLSVGPNSDFARGIRPDAPRNWRRRFPNPQQNGQPKQRRSGLNENYGRELMELHTLGVNGGYTQKDVTEVAKVFTGWTLKQPREGGGFKFDERMHQPGTKIVLGHKIKENGGKEGYEVLHILARNPATAKFVCNKLAMRFVSDNPPPELVDRMAKTFLKKDGDIREVLKTMLQSPEFWQPKMYRAKVKTPLEFVVSALRATGADVNNAAPLIGQLQNLGMPLYGAQPPTGYSMKADAWVSSSALLGRMNFAVRLASGRLRGVQVAPPAAMDQPGDSEQALAALETTLLAGDVSKQTHETISSRLQDPAITQRKLDDPARPPDVSTVEGLLLGSPEFQKR